MRPKRLSRMSAFISELIQTITLSRLYLSYRLHTRWQQAALGHRISDGNDDMPNLQRPLESGDASKGILHLLTQHRLDEVLSRYDVRTGVLDGRSDSTCLINSKHISCLLAELHKIESSSKFNSRMIIYGDTKTYKPLNTKFSSNQFLSLTSKLTKISNFYLEVHSISERGQQEVVFARQIFRYTHNPSRGLYQLSSLPEPVCPRVYAEDFNLLYPAYASSERSEITPSQAERAETGIYDVDVVITWVNNKDPEWQKQWNKRFGNLSITELEAEADTNLQAPIKQDSDRFSSSDELLYCLRSIDSYLNWIRNIYIVSNCSPPEWIDMENSRIHWIDHSEIMEAEVLPTFNSHAIESCLHKIKGLSEHFLYFNDDFVLLKPTSRSSFFDPLGRPLINAENYAIIRESYLNIVAKDYSIAAVNSMNALLAKGIKLPSALNLHAHIPYAHRKSLLFELEELLATEFWQTESSPLRSKTDINAMSFAAHWYGYSQGKYILNPLSSPRDYLIVKPSNIDDLIHKKVSPRFACFNDGDGTSKLDKYKQIVSSYLGFRLASRSFAEA